METFDYVIIGAGMGGLSAANFLTKYGKKVLVLEKHDKPGGIITSFKRHGIQFDCGIESLHELEKGETIPQFFEFWGTQIQSQKHTENICCYVDGNKYTFRGEHLKEDFIAQFPNDKKDIDRIFNINESILNEMYSDNSAPVPLYEMNLFQLVKFGMHNLIKKPTFMKYGMKNFDKVLSKLINNPIISSIVFSKAMSNMVYSGYAYRWQVINSSYYPIGGMQSIPNAAVEILEKHGGTLKLNTEVTEIIVEDGRAAGVKTKAGDTFYGNAVISNASPYFTYKLLPNDLSVKELMQKEISARKIFQGCCLLLLVVSGSFDFEGYNFLYIADSDSCRKDTESFTPQNCPIVMNVAKSQHNEKALAVTALAPIPYEYSNYWNTDANRGRGEKYRELKEEVKHVLLERICEKMGDDFRKSVEYAELATPITFERYTYSQNGSFMGWAIDKGNYGRFMKQQTALSGLHLVGQWVFPGFGVAGVLAGGYYLAKDLLKQDNIDLEKDFKEYFAYEYGHNL